MAARTEREREIIAVVREGLKSKQIGDRLFISEATVRNHLNSILSKLGFRTTSSLQFMPIATAWPSRPSHTRASAFLSS